MLILVLFSTIVIAVTYDDSIPDHTAQTVWVELPDGTETTLQQAIAGGLFGNQESVDIKSYLESNCRICVSYADNNNQRDGPGSWDCSNFGVSSSHSGHIAFVGNDDAWFKIECS